ncbi:hypothetical protein [Sulfuricella denitrificans]|uniref:hypothetical protein n=1 Tax=Sulfuricella denitrificans TaxID=649841 RepID=UPI0018E080C8|nr:hypothetical protein [Sulfuricella denitrificans]
MSLKFGAHHARGSQTQYQTSANDSGKASHRDQDAAARKTGRQIARQKVCCSAFGNKAESRKSGKATQGRQTKKIKMVRDSFTMPENDYAQLAELKKKCLQAGVHIKKSELLRAGLLSLSRLPNAALIKAVEQVEKLKTGRPAKS